MQPSAASLVIMRQSLLYDDTPFLPRLLLHSLHNYNENEVKVLMLNALEA